MAFDIAEFVNKTFRPQKGEKFLFMVDDSDEKRNNVVEEWAETLRHEMKSINVMDVLYHAQTFENGADLPEKGKVSSKAYIGEGHTCDIRDVLSEVNIVWSLPKYSATAALSSMKTEFVKQGKNFRVASSPNFQLDMIDTIMTENPEHIQERGKILLPKLKMAQRMEVQFYECGWHIYFDIRNVPWEEDLGRIFKKGDLGNIPFGELCGPQHEGSLLEYLLANKNYVEASKLVEFYRTHEVSPKSLTKENGSINKTKTNGFIPVQQGKDMVVYSITDGFVKHIREHDTDKTNETILEQRKKLAADPLWGYIAEVAFGLNSKARSDSPFMLEQEKSFIHFALGNAEQVLGYPTPFKSKETKHHHDYTLVNPKIDAYLIYPGDYKETIVENGKYTIFGELNF